MGVFVKICGIANQEDARAVAAMQPDAMGFILWQKSKRYVKPSIVGQWTASVPKSILKVGVFVDASPAEVRNAVSAAGLDAVQLHGAENPAAYRECARRVWRVVRPDKTAPAESDLWPVDALLVDTYSPEAPGGTGKVGDWDAARAFVAASRHPVLLAGGLTPDNVVEAIHAVSPWGVDVSSGVEDRPAKKDLEKVRRFIEQCRKT